MLLAVDIGNSHSSFGVFEKNKLLKHWRLPTQEPRTEDAYASFLLPLLEHANLMQNSWDGIVLCSVVPTADPEFIAFCEHYLRATPLMISNELQLGFELNVEFPNEVGADRLANAAFAVARLVLPAIVVDFGTAITLDVISQEKVYEGGAILPGIRLAFESLSAKTSKLPQVGLQFPSDVIGKNTQQCIQSGILYGYGELLSGLLRKTAQSLGGKPTIALTGGFSELYLDYLEVSAEYYPELTLHGSRILYEQNRFC